MGSTKGPREIRLPSFGTITGLVCKGGGYAEVLMTKPEVLRILDACRDREKGKKKPDEKFLAALDVVSRKAYARFGAAVITAEVPIAPVLRSVTLGTK